MATLGPGRLVLRRTPGLVFWRSLGTGSGSTTGPGADLGRTALFAVWKNADAHDRFIASAWPEAVEAWQVRLDPVGGHGRWHGFDVLKASGEPLADEPTTTTDDPIAMVTRADVRLRSWRAFRSVGHVVSDELQQADGLLDAVGIGEAPIGHQGTFSLWRNAAAATAFARSPHHAAVVRRTRAEGWYGEEMFAWFRPYASVGTWNGRDPLATTGTSMP